ncbi:MAG: hypothetical protein U0573_04675 [Phycisphaerales bacterium]|nr:hypothetical protein [Planctomycetota bacterium]
MREFGETIKIVACCIAAAAIYGVVHDQITARICIEYFTVAHPRLIDSSSPTAIGLAWGVAATWWVGLGLGILLSLAARVGTWPRRKWRDLIRPISLLLVVMAFYACFWGWLLPQIPVPPGGGGLWGGRIPAEKYRAFLVCCGAHGASYEAGFWGGLALCAWTLWGRKRAGKWTRAATA